MDSKEALFGVVAATALLVWLVIRWFITLIRKPTTPDPWGPEVAAALEQPDAKPLCPRCQCPHSPAQWFCPECGQGVGDYNNFSPYLCLFSIGDVLRAGTSGLVKKGWVTVTGYLILSLAEYAIFAPIYWYFLFRNLAQQADQASADAKPPGCAPENLG